MDVSAGVIACVMRQAECIPDALHTVDSGRQVTGLHVVHDGKSPRHWRNEYGYENLVELVMCYVTTTALS